MSILDNILLDNQKFIQAKEDIKKVYYHDDMPWVIGFSGGKDSTCTTQLVVDVLMTLKAEGKNLNKNVYIISSDTLVENPMIVSTIHETINNINNLAVRENLPISAHIIKPKYNNTFWANLIGRGYPCPNQTFRWCTDRMKIHPANDFIMNIVDKYGEAVMLLGVREGESNSRDRVLENHTIEGQLLMRHTTMSNAYIFAPIRSFTVDDVWEYLLTNDSPWGADNKKLFELYKDSSEDCPMMIDEDMKKTESCGNSRFGCWICTVVSKDKSLTSFIEKGESWLRPMLEFRNWLYSIRDNESKRMRMRKDGSIYFSKVSSYEDKIVIPAKGERKKIIIQNIDGKFIDNFGHEWTIFDGPNCEEKAKAYIFNNSINLKNGSNPHIIIKRINDEFFQLGPGPFTFEAREEMLRKLFELQKTIGDRCELFKTEELLEIRKIWFKLGQWQDNVPKIYLEVFGKELDCVNNDDIKLFDNKGLDILEKICNEKNLDVNILKDLFSIEQKYMGYNNRSEINKNIKKLFSQEFLHLDNGGEFDEN